jgi:hypothetical protein
MAALESYKVLIEYWHVVGTGVHGFQDANALPVNHQETSRLRRPRTYAR